MASSGGCTGVSRVNYFSNPEVDFGGKPTGNATADNARCIEDSMVSLRGAMDKRIHTHVANAVGLDFASA